MTKRSNRLGMYADVRSVLDAALASGGGEFECQDHGAAVHWRQRAYRFRKLYAETLGLTRESPYDVLVMPRIPEDSSIVYIRIRQAAGVFRPATGAAPSIAFDPLEDVAAAIAAKIERGEI